jgi:hypothetical protein
MKLAGNQIPEDILLAIEAKCETNDSLYRAAQAGDESPM